MVIDLTPTGLHPWLAWIFALLHSSITLRTLRTLREAFFDNTVFHLSNKA